MNGCVVVYRSGNDIFTSLSAHCRFRFRSCTALLFIIPSRDEDKKHTSCSTRKEKERMGCVWDEGGRTLFDNSVTAVYSCSG